MKGILFLTSFTATIKLIYFFYCVPFRRFLLKLALYELIYFNKNHLLFQASHVALVVKNTSANAGDKRDAGSSELEKGTADPLEDGRATRLSILTWRIPWTEEPGQAKIHRFVKRWTQLK